MSHQSRLASALSAAVGLGADSLLASDLVSVRYLSGFSGSNGAVLHCPGASVVATDGRYTAQAQAECSGAEVVTTRDLIPELIKRAATLGCRVLAVEETKWTLSQQAEAAAAADSVGVRLVDLGAALAALRMVKDTDEVVALERACEITVAAWQDLLEEGLSGRTELDLAGRLEHHFRLLGAEDRAFSTIVASGPNSAVPHHQPTDRVVAQGDLVKIDCGARVAGYHADFTRTVVVGEPATWQSEIHTAVRAAQAAALAQVAPGADALALDSVARAALAEAGYAERFVHPLGHAVGLEIHERPILGREAAILRPNMALTIEPGVYLPGLGGVRIEDTVLVTESGYRNLTNADRGLLSL